MKKQTSINDPLSDLIQAAHSPFHCCQYIMDNLVKEGFKVLSLSDTFKLAPGGKYVINVYDGTCIAFTIGKKVSKKTIPHLRMITSHTDWPSFVVKPKPDLKTNTYVRLNTEPYGGAVYHTWIDRPLGIAGKICLKTKNPFSPDVKFFDSKKSVATIPGLAIHMDSEINSDLKLNAQNHLLPLFLLSNNENDGFLGYLSKELSCKKEDILDYELFLYNADPCEKTGINEEFLSAPRLDNCSSVLACLEAIKCANQGADMICISAFYHNEEIGNLTKQGAASNITNQILERIFENLLFPKESLYKACANGLCLSLDVAHALHPAYPEKNDPTNKVCLGDGVCIKLSARQSYATDATQVSIIQGLCDQNKIPYGKFSNRSDKRGGSTLGTVASAAINIPCVDAGVPLLSMHSARELIALSDEQALIELSKKLFA